MPRTPDVRVSRDSPTLVRVADDFALPERFSATITPAEQHAPICHLGLVVEYGRPVCEQLRLERRPGGPPITGTELRDVKLADYVRRATDELLRELLATENPSGPVTVTVTDFGTATLDSEPFDAGHAAVRVGGLTLTPGYRAQTRAPRRPGPVSDAVLRDVAAVYREALLVRAGPTNAVRDGLGVSRATAGRWVAMARARGLLGPAQPGVAGERPPT